jgi:hypothetical protein
MLSLFTAPLRLTLVCAVLASTYASLHAHLLATLAVLLAWGAIVPRALDDAPDRGNDAATEQLVVAAVVLRTLLVLDQHGTPSADVAWFVVVAVAVVFTWAVADSPKVPQQRAREHTLTSVVALVLLVAMLGVEMSGASTTPMRAVLLVAEIMTWVQLLGTPGESAPVLAIYLQATALLVEPALAFRLVVLVMLFVAAVLRDTVVGLKALVVRVRATLRSMLTASTPYQMVVLVAVAVLGQSLSQPWFTTHVSFPEILRKQCNLLLEVIDIVRVGYEFTTDPDFQESLLPVLPELAQVRAIVFRSVYAAYKPLAQCSDGKTHTFTPTGDVISLAFFVPLAIVALCVLLQIFPGGGGGYVRSPVFWGVGAVSGMTFTVVTQLASDAPVMFWFFLFTGSESTRQYTDAGVYALLASLVFTGACLALSVLTSWASQPPASQEIIILTGPLKRLVHYVISPPVLVLGVAGFVLSIAIATGSPFANFEVYKKPSGAPEWLVSTTVDKAVAIGASTFAEFIAKSDPEVRMVLIAAALVDYGVKKIGTWGCLCIDDLLGAFSAVGDFFKTGGGLWRRRRLLEHKPGRTSYGLHAVAHRRRLLGGDCRLKVCVTDVVRNIVEEVTSLATKGLKLAMKLVSIAIRALVPYAEVFDKVFDVFAQLDDLVDFDLLAMPEINLKFQTKMLGFDFGTLATFTLPSASTFYSLLASALAIVIIAVGSGYLLGLLEPLVASTLMSVQLVVLGAVAALTSAILVFLYALRSQLQAEGYDVRFEIKANMFLYGLSLLSAVAGLLLAAAAAPVDPVTLAPEPRQRMMVEKRPLLVVQHPPVRSLTTRA